jgi:hypothetical protein
LLPDPRTDPVYDWVNFGEAASEGADKAAKAIARRQEWEDIYWAVLTLTECLFLH